MLQVQKTQLGKVGFCCKWVSPEGDEQAEGLVNQVDTTVTRLSKMSKADIEALLLDKVTWNLNTLARLVSLVGDYPEERRLLRFTSEILPCYTHEVATWAYSMPSLRNAMESGFARVGNLARSMGVRVGFHPDHFVKLNTSKPDILQKSLQTIEMHVEQMRMMGFTGGWHPHGATINVHLGAKGDGVIGFINNWDKLSDDAKNLLTIENDEFSFDLTSLRPVAEYCPIVTDIYHEWVSSKGNYIQPDDPRITEYVIPSWRGQRPLGHFSQPREEYCPNHDPAIAPSFMALKAKGYGANTIRSHSDFCWNTAMNDWAISHLSWMDIEVEAKMKNRASEQLYQQFKGL